MGIDSAVTRSLRKENVINSVSASLPSYVAKKPGEYEAQAGALQWFLKHGINDRSRMIAVSHRMNHNSRTVDRASRKEFSLECVPESHVN